MQLQAECKQFVGLFIILYGIDGLSVASTNLMDVWAQIVGYVLYISFIIVCLCKPSKKLFLFLFLFSFHDSSVIRKLIFFRRHFFAYMPKLLFSSLHRSMSG